MREMIINTGIPYIQYNYPTGGVVVQNGGYIHITNSSIANVHGASWYPWLFGWGIVSLNVLPRSTENYSPDIFFRLSITGRIEYVASGIKEQYGYQPDKLIGKHIKATTPARDFPRIIKALKAVLK